MDELHNRLFSLPDWGYVIYRTTYSAESDALFPDAIRYIEACIKDGLFSDGPDAHNLAPEIWPKYRSTIMEDPMNFNGASLEEIRSHFEAWVDGQGMRDAWTKYRMCIIIDEESLQTLKGATVEEAESTASNFPIRYVKVLEAFPIVDEYDTFPGWMKCWTHVLWFLWENMGDGDEMRMQFESIREEDDGVYIG